MTALLARVRHYIQRHALLPAGAPVVVGVSGGPDSLCLLHLLRQLSAEMGFRLHVAHLHHGLRGAEADADAAFVADQAARWDLPCTIGRADVARLAAQPGISPEEAARRARYRFLARVAVAQGATTIAVGHNADDQAETVLMHFLRGSGIAGLRGMLPRTALSEYRLLSAAVDQVFAGFAPEDGPALDGPMSGLILVRPLLATPRAEIEDYCAAHALQPRFDRSNEDTTFYRNRLRYELLPALASYNPAIRQVLARTAEVMAGDYDLLRAELLRAWEQVARPRAFSVTGEAPVVPAAEGAGRAAQDQVLFDLAAWRSLPLALQRATVREAIHRLRYSLRNINWEHVERGVRLARVAETGQQATLAAGLALEVGYETLRIAQEGEPQAVDVPQVAGPLPLAAPGTTALPAGWRATVRRLQADELPTGYDANADPWLAWLDADALGGGLVLRPRLPGDRFQPQGLGGHSTKVNEFMINARIPRAARAGWPLLDGACGIAWICGLRLDERAAVRSGTRAVWRIQLYRE